VSTKTRVGLAVSQREEKAGEGDVDKDVTEPEDTLDTREKQELELDERELEREWAEVERGDGDLMGGERCWMEVIHVGELTSSAINVKSRSSSSWSTSRSC
jgi:hypothetical protein